MLRVIGLLEYNRRLNIRLGDLVLFCVNPHRGTKAAVPKLHLMLQVDGVIRVSSRLLFILITKNIL